MGLTWQEEKVRLFVAGDLPYDAAVALTEWQVTQLDPRPELRVTTSVHLTLCFLGHVARARVPEIAEALRSVRFTPFPLEVADVLFLPERRLKRVVALRVDDPTGSLVALQAEVSSALAGLGVYKPEKRPYLPHMTVARYRRQGQPFSLQNVTIPRFLMDRVVLYSSLLERGGAVHTPLEVFPAS
jgi:RNA 2',3'-cyclic 3'-phosphodiesterase